MFDKNKTKAIVKACFNRINLTFVSEPPQERTVLITFYRQQFIPKEHRYVSRRFGPIGTYNVELTLQKCKLDRKLMTC